MTRLFDGSVNNITAGLAFHLSVPNLSVLSHCYMNFLWNACELEPQLNAAFTPWLISVKHLRY